MDNKLIDKLRGLFCGLYSSRQQIKYRQTDKLKSKLYSIIKFI